MLLYKKKLLYLIALAFGIYFLFYVGMLEFKLISINTLVTVKYFVITFILLCILLAVCILWKTKKALLKFLYLIISFSLILFFVSSIFIFKTDDLFFWRKNKELADEFFKFAFWMLSMNYILALPYLVILVIEIAFLIKHGMKKTQ
jgi:hypothetical protein